MSETANSTLTAIPDRPSLESVRLDAVPHHRIAAAEPDGRGTFYIGAWGAIALAAGLYLAALVFKPPLLTDWLPSLDNVLSQPRGADQNGSGTNHEAKHLRVNLEQAQSELAQLRQELGTRDARVKSAELRIAGLEKELEATRDQESGAEPQSQSQPQPSNRNAATVPPTAFAPGTTVVPTSDDTNRRALADAIGTPSASDGAPAENTQPRSFEIVNGAPRMVNAPNEAPTLANAQPGTEVAMPVPERRPVVFIRQKTSPIAQIVRPTVSVVPTTAGSTAGSIETGSVSGQSQLGDEAAATATATQPVTFGAPTVTRSATSVGIRLTAAPSVDALRLSWSLMSERYASELNGLQPRYVAGGAPAAPYSLVAGPFSDQSEAQRRCALLIARGIPCSVDSFTGNAL